MLNAAIVALGIDSGRPGVHAPGQRVADHVLARDDPDLVLRGLAQQRRLRLGALALGARLRTLVRVAARVEVAQQQELERQLADPIEEKVVEKIVAATNVERSSTPPKEGDE